MNCTLGKLSRKHAWEEQHKKQQQQKINLSSIQITKPFPAYLTLELAPDKEGTKRNIQRKNAVFSSGKPITLIEGKWGRNTTSKKSSASLGNNTPWFSFEIFPIHMQYNELYWNGWAPVIYYLKCELRFTLNHSSDREQIKKRESNSFYPESHFTINICLLLTIYWMSLFTVPMVLDSPQPLSFILTTICILGSHVE